MTGRSRIRRLLTLAVMVCVFLAAVVLIPAAPGQTGAGNPLDAAPTAAARPDLPWRPFIDPLNIHQHWYWLLIPMAFGVSVAYKAVRLQSLDRYWAQVMFMTAQIVVAMMLLGLATYLVVMRFAPWIAAQST